MLDPIQSYTNPYQAEAPYERILCKLNIDPHRDELNVKHGDKVTTIYGRVVLPVLYDEYADEGDDKIVDDLRLLDDPRIDFSGLYVMDDNGHETPLHMLADRPTNAEIIGAVNDSEYLRSLLTEI